MRKIHASTPVFPEIDMNLNPWTEEEEEDNDPSQELGKSIVKMIEEAFEQLQPLVHRRICLLKTKYHKSASIVEYLNSFTKMGKEAKLNDMTGEQFLCMLFIYSLRDNDEFMQKFLPKEGKNLTLEFIRTKAHDYEVTRNAVAWNKRTEQDVNVAFVRKQNTFQQQQRGSAPQSRNVTFNRFRRVATHVQFKHQCPKCGCPEHKPN